MKNRIISFILGAIIMAGSTSCFVSVRGKRRPHGHVKVVVQAPPKENLPIQSTIMPLVPQTPVNTPVQSNN